MKFFVLLGITSALFGSSFTWTGTTNNDWNTITNWTPNTGFPNAIDDVATFSSTFTNQPNVGASTFIVGTINFQTTPTGTTISGTGGSLNFSVSSASASIAATTTGHIISVPMTLTSNLLTNIAQNSIVTLSGSLSGASSFTVGGLGTTALTGSNSFSGGVIVNSGILQINADSALGSATNTVTLSGTLQASGPVTSSRNFTLGSAIFDTNTNSMTLSGILSGNSLTKIGSGILTLSGTNTYSGGTAVNVGTLKISSDSNLGATTSVLSFASGTTLQAGNSFVLGPSRPVTVTGSVTVDTGVFSPTIASNISGSGSITVTGTQLTLTGTNTYTGSTTVNGARLIGNTTSLQGNINAINAGSVIFNQPTSGTYASVYHGALGTTLSLQGGGTYTFSGNSSLSLGTINLVNSHLILTGSLGATTLTIDAGSNLSGTGTVITSSGLFNSGKITPGLPTGTLHVTGNVTFTPGSGTLVSLVEPETNSLLQVSGTATLTDGILSLAFDPNVFYSLTSTHTLLIAGSRVGTFGSVLVSDPHFSPTILYTPTTVELVLTNLTPFRSFDFKNSNERAVGQNIDALSTAFALSEDLTFVINSLAGESTREVNRALDQMHPAAISALAEIQTTLGGQLLNRMHQRSGFACGCDCNDRSFFWVEPFGNWLQEKKQGMQIGFKATTRGLSLGFDQRFFDCWTFGVAGTYQITDLHWSLHRGYAYVHGGYGSIYSDINAGRFYLGASAYYGKDWNHIVRHIRFSTIDRQAKSRSHAMDTGGQLTSAYFFGNRSFQLFPYGTVDFLYLKNSSFAERGAESLSLEVQGYRSSTLRAESGLGMRFVDYNIDETICLTPLFSMGYVLELPLHRDHFRARFAGMPIGFRTEGWEMAWQLMNLRCGLTLSYSGFSLESQYIVDFSTEGNKPYMNQRANFRLGFQF